MGSFLPPPFSLLEPAWRATPFETVTKHGHFRACGWTPIMSLSHGRRDADHHRQPDRPPLRGPDPEWRDLRHRSPEDDLEWIRFRVAELRSAFLNTASCRSAITFI